MRRDQNANVDSATPRRDIRNNLHKSEVQKHELEFFPSAIPISR